MEARRDRSFSPALLVTVLALAVLAFPGLTAAAGPQVSNVQAYQRPDRKVEVSYDLSNAPSSGATVSIKFSQNGGVSYTITPSVSALSGDVGEGIGNGHHTIVWNAPSTLPAEFYSTQMKAAVTVSETGGGGGGTITITLPGGVTMEFIHIPAGTFTMGSPASERGRWDDEDLHQVTLTQGYYMGKYEVTQAQWQAVMGTNPSEFSSCGGDCPVENVSWNEICGGATGSSCTSSSFIGKLNAYLGTAKLRLPTEAEWERAARAGTETPFSFGDDTSCLMDDCSLCTTFDRYMWWCGNSGSQTQRVGSKQPNGYGLYDMHGNVFEWVADRYGDYPSSSVTDPTGPLTGSLRVLRGGSCYNIAQYCRSALRFLNSPGDRSGDLGVRLAGSESSVQSGTGFSGTFAVDLRNGGGSPPLSGAGPNTYLIPASAHAPGKHGTSWVSDVVLYNVGKDTASVNLYYLEGNHDNRLVTGKRVSVPAEVSVKLGDVVGSTFGGSSSSGALYLGSDQPLKVASRTYNDASSGTYGQFIAGMPTGELIGASETVRLIQLTRNGEYRANIGFANASDTEVTVEVKLYGSDGSYIATRSYTIQPYGFYQKTDIIGTDISDAYAVISSSTSGARFYTYASVIDNRTGDPVFITPRAGAASTGKSLYIPGSAHVNGAGGTQWRTDMEIHNPGNSAASYRVELLKRDQANSSPQSKIYNLAPGHSVRYTDALNTVFGFTGTAALRITPSSGTVMVTSRTYNKTSEGTYGQFIAAVPASRAIAEGESVPLVQLADSASTSSGYRTNIGLVNTTNKTIAITADLHDGFGSRLGTSTVNLRAFEYTQMDRIFRSVASATLDNCYAVLGTATSGGAFLTYGSVVDNRSGDPVYVPATGGGGGGGGTCTITMSSPNGGESWRIGSTHTVQWTKSGLACGSEVRAELLKGGQVVSTIRTATPNDGALTWTIPSSLSAASNYSVRLTDLGGTGASDTSDGYFSLTGGSPAEITITLPGGVTMELVHIPAGAFMMGSPTDERGRSSGEDLHQVTLTRGYYMGKYEVTQAQWQAVMGTNPSHFSSCGGDCPVEQVSWNDVCGGTTGSDCASSSFIGKLNAYLGTTKFRLPTDAEWERAARAGTQTEFSFDVPSNWDTDCGSFPEGEAHMWWCGNMGAQTTHRVGSKQPNGYGLYDVHGSVWEWVADWYSDYAPSAVTDPKGPLSGSIRVKRGGNWVSLARLCRSATRGGDRPGSGADLMGLGFRLARSE